MTRTPLAERSVQQVQQEKRRLIVYCVEVTNRKVTQQNLADLAGVSQATICNVFHGRVVASKTMDAVINALNTFRREDGLAAITEDDVIWTWKS